MAAIEGPCVQVRGDVYPVERDGAVEVDRRRVCAPGEALAVAFFGDPRRAGLAAGAHALRGLTADAGPPGRARGDAHDVRRRP